MSVAQDPVVPVTAGGGRRRDRRRFPTVAIAERLGFGLLTLLLISMITFAATGTKSADEVALTALGRQATPEQLDLYIAREGLDKPPVERYGLWLKGFVQGDWGRSALNQQPVKPDVLDRLVRTLILAVCAWAIALSFGLVIAVFSARRSGSPVDVGLQMLVVLLAAIPEFVIGIGLLMVFGITLGWLPVDNTAIAFGTTLEKAKTYVLPVLTLAIVAMTYIIRIGRAAMRESLAAPFTQAAILRGLPRRTVLWDHAMRTASTPILNAVGLTLIYLLGGVIIVENLFGIPGLGSRLVEGILQGDAPTVQAIALLLGLMFILVNFVVDLLVLVSNPRLRGS